MENDSYGLGKERHKYFRLAASAKELGFTPPKGRVSSTFYEHEKLCGDVFVALYVAGFRDEWNISPLRKGFIPDRTFHLGPRKFYLEVETSSQWKNKIRNKLANYYAHQDETNEAFHVLFLGKDPSHLDMIMGVLNEFETPPQYMVAIHADFIADPMHASILNRFTEFTLSEEPTK